MSSAAAPAPQASEAAPEQSPITMSADALTQENSAAATNAQKGDGKKLAGKDRKPRRERPPLPDPLPEKLVTKYPEPSKDELQKKIEVHDNILKDCFQKLSDSRAFFSKRAEIREAGKDEFETARKRMSAKNDELKQMFDQRKEYSAQIKTIRDQDVNARNQASDSSGRDAEMLRDLKTVEDVDNHIKNLETRQHTVSMSILEEKKLIARISYLKHTGRELILGRDQAFQQQKAAKAARAEKKADLEAQRKALDKKIDAEKATLEEFKKEVDGIRKKQDEQIKKIQEQTANIDRDKVKEKITEQKALIRKLRDDFSTELDKWYLNERIYVEQIKVQKRKKFEAIQAEREERRKKWEEEQAQYPEPDPYQKEKDMIAGLTVYLQTILGEITEKATTSSLLPKGNAPSLKTGEKRSVTTAGKAVGKGVTENFEDISFGGFVGKKSKAKGKKGRRGSVALPSAESGSSDENLKPCPIDLLRAFNDLDVTPPNKLSEVRTALEEVRKKKEYYDSNPPLPEPKPETREAPKKKTGAKANGKAAEKELTSSGAFPGLNGVEDSQAKPVESGSVASRPSFSEIAKGNAVAPAPPVNSVAYPSISEETVPADPAPEELPAEN